MYSGSRKIVKLVSQCSNPNYQRNGKPFSISVMSQCLVRWKRNFSIINMHNHFVQVCCCHSFKCLLFVGYLALAPFQSYLKVCYFVCVYSSVHVYMFLFCLSYFGLFSFHEKCFSKKEQSNEMKSLCSLLHNEMSSWKSHHVPLVQNDSIGII